MLTVGEKNIIKVLIPLWVLGCFGIAGWLAFRVPIQAHAPTMQPEHVVTPKAHVQKPAFGTYIEITGGCGPSVDASCVAVYTAPNHTAAIVTQLREGIVLQISDATTTDSGVWYKVTFNEWLRYPNRVTTEWYVPHGEYTRVFIDDPTHEWSNGDPKPEHKYIVVDRSEQALYAYEGKTLVMTQTISTGILATPTPRGTFTIYKKTPSRYMQGPIPGISTKHYDLPGVPWNLYFTEQGGVIHGAYWHNQFGTPWSNGCVNVPRGPAEELYHWADIGTTVFVRD